jgi:WD40 repeat protein
MNVKPTEKRVKPRTWLSLAFLAVTVLAFTAAPALAVKVHVHSSSFGSEGSGSGQFNEPSGIAVNEVTLGNLGDVYVLDKGNSRVQWFAFNEASKLYEYAGQFNGEHTPAKSFAYPRGIAVDNSTNPLDLSAGDVYVADAGESELGGVNLSSHDVVDRFSPTGGYEGQLTGTCELPGESAPCAGSKLIAFPGELVGVAVDPEGNLFVYDKTLNIKQTEVEGEVIEFSDTGVFLRSFRTGHGARLEATNSIAVDSSDDVYALGNHGDVLKFSSTGALLADIGNNTATGVAIYASANNLFVDTEEFTNGSGINLPSSVDEYGPFGEPYATPRETFPGFPAGALLGSHGVAVGKSSRVFASERAVDGVEVFDEVSLPEVEAVSNLTTRGVTLNGSVNPEDVEVTSCEWEYGTEAGVYPQQAACLHAAPLTGNAPVPVSANLAGLSPGTVYHYRLIVTNADHVTIPTPDHELTTRGPRVSEEQVTGVEMTAATLNALIDPNGAATTYHFEYGSSESYGQSTPESLSVGADGAEHPATARITGLAPGTTYHYRVVADSEPTGTPEAFDGLDRTFTTNASGSSAPENCPNEQLRSEQPYGATLPDCRAYEMVSPLYKDDNSISAQGSRAAVSGEAITYKSVGSFSEPKSALSENQYVARRGPGGWSTQSIMPPYSINTTQALSSPFEELFFTPDLSQGLLLSQYTPLVAGEPEGYINIYLANIEQGSYQTVTNVTPPETRPFQDNYDEGAPKPEGASTDLSHVVFQQSAALTEGAAPNQMHVYEWAGGELRQVDVGPAGAKLEGSDTVGTEAIRDSPEKYGDTWHAVSADGSKVFFTSEGRNLRNEGHVYVRENPMSLAEDCSAPGDACTVEVSASQKTNGSGPNGSDPNGPQPAYYRGASTNGERVFFTSRAELTDDAYTGPKDNAANLYEYNLETGVLSDLTVVTEAQKPEDPAGAAVLGLVAASDDGSYVYFVANGVLSEAANGEGAKATPGDCKEQLEEVAGEHTCSLYVEHYNGTAWEAAKFIAMLAGSTAYNPVISESGDEHDWEGLEYNGRDFGPNHHTARVTPDGTRLAFQSERSLTGYENEPVQEGACGEQTGKSNRCREVYLYDAAGSGGAGSLICASCNPSGARPLGASELDGTGTGGLEEGRAGPEAEEEANSLIGDAYFYVPHNLSEDGGRLFFQSADALVPGDGNGKVDVYEWEQRASAAEAAKAESSCTPSSSAFDAGAEGCIFAVSDVAGDHASKFMDASASGNDVFIATQDPLVPSADMDSRENLYDVRVGGGFPVSLAAPVCVNADSCKPPVSAQPSVFGAPASATFSGPGNLAPAPPGKVAKKPAKCKKGFARNRKGKCVKHKHNAKKARAGNGRGGRR